MKPTWTVTWTATEEGAVTVLITPPDKASHTVFGERHLWVFEEHAFVGMSLPALCPRYSKDVQWRSWGSSPIRSRGRGRIKADRIPLKKLTPLAKLGSGRYRICLTTQLLTSGCADYLVMAYSQVLETKAGRLYSADLCSRAERPMSAPPQPDAFELKKAKRQKQPVKAYAEETDAPTRKRKRVDESPLIVRTPAPVPAPTRRRRKVLKGTSSTGKKAKSSRGMCHLCGERRGAVTVPVPHAEAPPAFFGGSAARARAAGRTSVVVLPAGAVAPARPAGAAGAAAGDHTVTGGGRRTVEAAAGVVAAVLKRTCLGSGGSPAASPHARLVEAAGGSSMPAEGAGKGAAAGAGASVEQGRASAVEEGVMNEAAATPVTDSAGSAVAPMEGGAGSAVPTEGGAGSAVPMEGGASSTVAPMEGQAGSAVAPMEGGASSTVPMEGGAGSAVPTEGGAGSAVPMEGGEGSAVAPMEGGASSTVAPMEGGAGSAVPMKGGAVAPPCPSGSLFDLLPPEVPDPLATLQPLTISLTIPHPPTAGGSTPVAVPDLPPPPFDESYVAFEAAAVGGCKRVSPPRLPGPTAAVATSASPLGTVQAIPVVDAQGAGLLAAAAAGLALGGKPPRQPLARKSAVEWASPSMPVPPVCTTVPVVTAEGGGGGGGEHAVYRLCRKCGDEWQHYVMAPKVEQGEHETFACRHVGCTARFAAEKLARVHEMDYGTHLQHMTGAPCAHCATLLRHQVWVACVYCEGRNFSQFPSQAWLGCDLCDTWAHRYCIRRVSGHAPRAAYKFVCPKAHPKTTGSLQPKKASGNEDRGEPPPKKAKGNEDNVEAAWPEDVVYSSSVDLSPVATDEQVASNASRIHEVVIKSIKAPAHPCCGGHGLFASVDIPRLSILGEYTGRAIPPNAGFNHSRYIMSHVSSKYLYDIDAESMGNEMRFANDYRGIEKEPNLAFKSCVVAGVPLVLGVTLAPIRKGSELLADYGTDYWERTRKPAK